MQNALIDFNPEYEAKFTDNIVLMNGLYFSFLLALLYVPTYTVYQYYDRKVRDKVYRVNSIEEHKEKIDQRKELEELLDLKITVG